MAEPSSPKKVVVLGSTGSIGESSLSVARDIPERMEVIGLAAHRSVDSLAKQLAEFDVKQGCIFDPKGLDQLKTQIADNVTLYTGEDGLVELATLPEADMVLIAIVGVAGLRPALAAAKPARTSPWRVRRSSSWPVKPS